MESFMNFFNAAVIFWVPDPNIPLVRIYSDNEPSKKLFEKLGAIQIGKEPSEFAEALAQLKESLKEEYEEILTRNPEAEKIASERYIVQYKYLLK